jgi:HPt (histidine-containing phosphotransfer) domain-containing protein
MRASHVIKGAASNLMCAQLRKCAMELETTASAASKDNPDGKDADVMKGVEAKFEDLQAAVKKYHEYLESVGV